MDDRPPPPESVNVPPVPPPPVAPPPVITAPPPPPRGSGAVWKVLAFVFLALLVLSVCVNSVSMSRNLVLPRNRSTTDRNHLLQEVTLEHTNTTDNKIAVIDVDGIITSGQIDQSDMTLVDYISQQLQMAQHDSDVKAVILKVNSPGGEVLASDDINRAITRFEDESHKPVIASMQSLAASGGYYVSVPCRWIVANELTLTGSIGVIMHDYNYRTLMDKIGIRPHVFKSGRFKDMLSGEREPDTDKLSPEEQRNRDEEDAMVQSLIDETFRRFKQVVKTGRERAARENDGAGKTLVDDWQDYADGRVLSGSQALNFGFVDELGDFQTAVKRAKTIANISSASLIAYRMPFDFGEILSHVFGKSEVPAIKVELGMDLPKLEAGRLYFMMPTAVPH